MRLVSYERDGRWAPGIALDGRVVDTSSAAVAAGLLRENEAPWQSNRAVLGLDGGGREALRRAASELATTQAAGLPDGDLRLGPPIVDPEKIILLGLNYRDHADEIGMPVPTAPVLFAKYRNSLAGHDSPIRIPAAMSAVDYEGELAIVIGRRCANVAAADAAQVIAGAMALNDVSARDLQFQTGQWLAGKALDTFAPCGPELVLADELPDLQKLAIATRVNGSTMQASNTSEMIFTIAETIAFISRLMTLEVGDVISTGTPAGVGYSRTPPVQLRPGDVVEVEVEGIGTLRNPVVGEACKERR
jgi:2-keto-4-pentenoate hydratase/2-oxohepta-3-ene-1,7-dioic acid hydratase in catechol pathway